MTAITESITTPLNDFLLGKPGVYPGIPATEYHRLSAISASALKRVHTHSELHCKAVLDNPELISGDSLDIGAGVHSMTLTPDEFDQEFILAKQCEATVKASGNRCANSGIKCVSGQWVCGVHGKGMSCDYSGKAVLTLDEYRRVKGIHDSLWHDDKAREILRAATDFELSILWHDEETGLLNKARFDLICRDIGVFSDLKTCRSLKPSIVVKDFWERAYHIQLAHYRRGAIAVGIVAEIPCVIGVENEEPFDTDVYRPTDKFMEFGVRDMSAAMKKIKDCHRSGVWPGYAKGTQMLDVPAWAK
jgi:hypothetical protein